MLDKERYGRINNFLKQFDLSTPTGVFRCCRILTDMLEDDQVRMLNVIPVQSYFIPPDPPSVKDASKTGPKEADKTPAPPSIETPLALPSKPSTPAQPDFSDIPPPPQPDSSVGSSTKPKVVTASAINPNSPLGRRVAALINNISEIEEGDAANGISIEDHHTPSLFNPDDPQAVS